jgi:predicted enzyme related to lactoylglutathione lyase
VGVGFKELLGWHRVYGEILVSANDVERAIAWYGRVFDLVAAWHRKDQTEIPMGYAGQQGDMDPILTLVAIPVGSNEAAVGSHPVLFTKGLETVHRNLIAKGVNTGPIQSDSGGNRFFEFLDCEGNRVEVCREPGSR